MRIAILGTRGIPAAYGGFETLAEQLSWRLAARGHDVTVYARPHGVRFRVPQYRGVRVIHLPTIPHKYLDTVVHGVLSGIHAASQDFDVVLFCNGINALACRLPKLLFRGTVVALNVDGLEKKRRKWNALGKLAYSMSERLSCVLPDAVVTDARQIHRYYAEKYGVASSFVPYGSDLPRPETVECLERLGLRPDGYVLYVSRFEPENNPDAVIEGFSLFKKDIPLVLVGSAPYSSRLIEKLKQMASKDPRVQMPGAFYGDAYHQLLSHAAVYVHATEVGGTHPALLEAMGAARPVLVNDTPENREVAGETALYFEATKPKTLARVLSEAFENEDRRRQFGNAAYSRASRDYRWDDITTLYERLFEQALFLLR